MNREKISEDRKKLIIDRFNNSERAIYIANSLNMNVNTVRCVVRRFKKNKVISLPRGHRPRKL